MAAFHLCAASRVCLAAALMWLPAPAPAQAPPDGVTTLLRRLEQAAAAGDRAAIGALGDTGISRPSFEDFAVSLTSPPPSRVVLNERDRAPLEGGVQRLVVEVFAERGVEARLGTWRVDVKPGTTTSDPWRIAAVSRLSIVTGLYRLSLNAETEYDVHDLVVRAPDLALEFPSGRAFVAETPDGPTAMVLLGRGRMRFTPPDPAERTQVHIFSGSDALDADLDMAFLRFSPYEFESLINAASLRPRQVNPSDLRNASSAFNDLVGRTLQVDLADLSRDRWSLTPAQGDVIAELRTRKFGSLTYARSAGEEEDVTIFDRKRRRNISVYASAAKLAERGRFYSEDDRLDYDVLAYELDLQMNPDRIFIEGNARLRIRIRSDSTSSLTLKLAETVTVRGVYSPDFGRLLHLRVVGQNSLIVNLPALVDRGKEMWLNVMYGGPVTPQTFDREAIQIRDPQVAQEPIEIPLQPRYLYSNRSYWYPQSTVTDYATATIRLTIPNDYDAVATGELSGPPASTTDSGQRRRKTYVFEASRPVRYLAVVLSRFIRLDTSQIGSGGSEVSLQIQGTPRAGVRGREMTDRTASIFAFYTSLVGDAPYPSFTLALAESDRPGGHSPPYFAVLNQVVPGSRFVWRNDPVSFENYPAFFLAHEVAHQWWGHAVGWKNYHEQWISEGFAQYFAALYAEKDRADDVLPSLLRQMGHTAIEASGKGPVYLGYRLGHIEGDDRIFRSLVYNKGAMVLHMLRRLVGDEAFFAGVRAFYTEWKFKKAGTGDFQRAMELASLRNLERFFGTWIFGSEIPHVRFSYHVSGTEANIRFEQRGDPVDVPITVTVTYMSGITETVVVILSSKETEQTLILKGPVRRIAANADNAALVEIDK
jgi:hypothetical protein